MFPEHVRTSIREDSRLDQRCIRSLPTDPSSRAGSGPMIPTRKAQATESLDPPSVVRPHMKDGRRSGSRPPPGEERLNALTGERNPFAYAQLGSEWVSIN